MRISRFSIFYSVGALSLSNLLLQALSFLYRVFLSRKLGAEGMGVYQLVLPLYALLSALTLSGLSMAVSQRSAEACAAGCDPLARRTVRVSLRLFFCGAIAASVFLLLLQKPVAALLGDSRTGRAFLPMAACLLGTGAEHLIKHYFFGIRSVKAPICAELAEQITRFAAVAAFLLLFPPGDAGDAAVRVFCGMAVSELASVGVLAAFYGISPASRARVLGGILRISLPVGATHLLQTLLSSANSVLIPRRLAAYGMSGAAALSLFGELCGMTLPLLSAPMALLAPVLTVTVPKLSAAAVCGDCPDLRRKAGKAIHATGLLAFPAAIFFFLFGAPVSALLYGRAGAYLPFLALAMIPAYYQTTTAAILNGIGKQSRAAGILLLCGGLELCFTLMIGRVGMFGFLAGSLLPPLLAALAAFRVIVRTLRLSVRWRNWFLTPALSALFAGAAAWCLRPVGSLFAAGLGAMLYLLALRAQGVDFLRYLKRLVPQGSR